MTAIASFSLRGLPFLISDVLISVELNPTDRRIQHLPEPIKRFNAYLPADSQYTISDVLQKTVRICDGFVLSYAGTVAHARDVISHFRQVAQAREPSGQLFEHELQWLADRDRLKDLGLLALIQDGSRIYYGAHNTLYLRSRKFRILKAAGSGGRDLLDTFGAYRGKTVNRYLGEQEEGLSLALSLSSILVGRDVVTGEPTTRAYGGLYEVSYWQGKDFTKLTDVLHVHWIFEYEPGHGLSFDPPVKIQKVEYHGSVLYFRDIEFDDHGQSEDVVYVVDEPAVDGGAARPPRIRPGLSYKWCVSHLYIRLPNGQVRYRNRVTYTQESNYQIIFQESGPQIEMQFQPAYFDVLTELVNELQTEFG